MELTKGACFYMKVNCALSSYHKMHRLDHAHLQHGQKLPQPRHMPQGLVIDKNSSSVCL